MGKNGVPIGEVPRKNGRGISGGGRGPLASGEELRRTATLVDIHRRRPRAARRSYRFGQGYQRGSFASQG